MIQRLLYRLLYSVVWLISLLPLRALYIISDAIYPVLYHIVRYRRKMVRRHLRTSFPEKSEAEIRDIERQFYHWLCDYVVETIKLLTISDDTLLHHIEFRNVSQLEEYFDRGQDCAAILGHYCNWEWLSATGLAFEHHPEAVMGLIYHPLYNDAFNQLFIQLRAAHGGVCIPKKDILRYLVQYRRDNTRSLFGYIADQTPRWTNIHLWLPFMHQDTPAFTGAERIMRKMHDAVFYVDMERPRRGHYICTFRLMTDQPQDMPEFELTRQFFQMLEESIRRQPAYYLWTHNRWKRTHAEFDRRYKVVDGKVLEREKPTPSPTVKAGD